MTDPSWEEQRFYHRANTAIDVAEGAAYAGLAWALWQQGAEERARLKAQHGPMPTTTKAWWWSMLGFIVMVPVIWMVQGGSESYEESVDPNFHHSSWPWILCLVLAAVCFVAGLVHGAYEDSQRPPSAPAAAAPATPKDWPPRPTQPPVTQTRVERSVRVVRAPAAATTHHNSEASVAAIEAPHKDVEQSTDLVVIRHHQRPPLWTEDHGAYRSVDRRSFDRDIGPV